MITGLGVATRLVGVGVTAARAAVTSPALVSRAAGAAVRTAVTPAAALVREARVRLEGGPTRRIWSAQGRAQIEMVRLTGQAAAVVATSVEDVLKALPGVVWARVDVVTRRAVIRFDAAQLTAADLADAVARAEHAAGVDGVIPRHDDLNRSLGTIMTAAGMQWAAPRLDAVQRLRRRPADRRPADTPGGIS